MAFNDQIIHTDQAQPTGSPRAGSVDGWGNASAAEFEQLYARYKRAGYEMVAIIEQTNRKPATEIGSLPDRVTTPMSIQPKNNV